MRDISIDGGAVGGVGGVGGGLTQDGGKAT